MKKFIYLLFILLFLCSQAQSKVVKLGRNINATTSYRTLKTASLSGIAKECDASCIDCNKETGMCLKCGANRYISGKLCLICPEKSYCDGEKAIQNCSGVTCLGNAIPQATNTGCCCVIK